jgi:hypothetical protein
MEILDIKDIISRKSGKPTKALIELFEKYQIDLYN